MIAVSAIGTGLPGGVVQKNRDAALLAPASLLDGSLGNRVHIRRTDGATGKVTEEEAIIHSGAAGAVVLQTAAGYEALRCTGLPETRSEEHTSELQSLMRISYAVFCLKKIKAKDRIDDSQPVIQHHHSD